MDFYQRNLPHWQPGGAEYFVTFRLAGSIPKEAVARIKNLKIRLAEQIEEKPAGNDEGYTTIDRKIFRKYENLLENENHGPTWLEQPKVAQLVGESMEYRNENCYDLYAYCIMPNHVHLAFRLLGKENNKEYSVTNILQNLKGYTGSECNNILNRKGQFWQRESFDRVIRDNAELSSTIKYILNNPVKAGLVNKWQNWPYSYCKSIFKQ